MEEPLRHAAGGRDDDDHDELRLQEQHLDVADVRHLERRRGDEGEEPRHLREHLGRRLKRRLDLGARRREVERERRRLRLEVAEQLVGEVAVAGLGRDAPGRGVRMREEAERLELRQLGADGRRRDAQVGALDERLRPDRLPSRRTPRRRAAGSPSAVRSAAWFPAFAGDFSRSLGGSRRSLRISAVTPPPRKRPRA